MRCHICDANLSEKEVIYNKELQAFEPCTTCLDIAMDAAYCDGFLTEDDDFVVLDQDFDDTEIPLPYVPVANDDEIWSS